MKNTHTNKSINLSISEIDSAVIELSKKLGISGSYSNAGSMVDLYKLLQNYLLDIEVRRKINEIIKPGKPASFGLADKEFEALSVTLLLTNGITTALENNIVHYLKLKCQHLDLSSAMLEAMKNKVINHLKANPGAKELVLDKVNKKSLIIMVDDQKFKIIPD